MYIINYIAHTIPHTCMYGIKFTLKTNRISLTKLLNCNKKSLQVHFVLYQITYDSCLHSKSTFKKSSEPFLPNWKLSQSFYKILCMLVNHAVLRCTHTDR